MYRMHKAYFLLHLKPFFSYLKFVLSFYSSEFIQKLCECPAGGVLSHTYRKVMFM